jgi:hypothetical protein
MSLQYGAGLRDGHMNSINTTLGATATIKIFSGTVAANCGAADPSGTLCTIILPSSPFIASSSGAIAKNGTWSVAASGAGTAASYRIYDSSAACQIQGNVTTDLVLNNTSIASGQTVTVTGYTLTAGNA